jgi:hypothetical protein
MYSFDQETGKLAKSIDMPRSKTMSQQALPDKSKK